MERKDYKLLIIGAGPGGISMAAEARAAGVKKEDILILDKASEHSYVIRSLYPAKKQVTANYKGIKAVCHGAMCLPDTDKAGAISYMDKVIERAGLNVRYNEEVYKVKSIGTEEETMFDITTSKGNFRSMIVIVAIGIFGRPNKPSYKLPVKLKGKVHFDVNSFEANGEKILVVGGGDSASEYAQFLIEWGNDVELSYRRDSFVKMNPVNQESALILADQKKLNILWSSNINELGVSESGNPLVYFEEEKYGVREFDRIIYALGGSTPENFLAQMGIEFSGGSLEIDHRNESKIPGLFVAGDLAAGKKGGSIVSAFNSSQEVMIRICRKYLECREKRLKFDYHILHFVEKW